MHSADEKHSFTDVLTDTSEIIDEPRFLKYTQRFHEAPDGEIYFLPLREFFMLPIRWHAYPIRGADDERFVFNLLKLRNALAFFVLFLLICVAVGLHFTGVVPALPVYPEGLKVVISVIVGTLVGFVPVNLWAYLLFCRHLRRQVMTRPPPADGP